MAAFKKNLGPVASIDLDECSEEPLSPTSPALPESPEPSEPVMMRTDSNSECPAQTLSASNELQKPAEHVPLDVMEVYSSPHPLSPTSAATDEQQEEFERATTTTSADRGRHDGKAVLPHKPHPTARGCALREMWADHEGFGLCVGIGKHTCRFGRDGKQARAGPDGMCDLCDSDALHDLYENFQGRLTHLLRALSEDVRPRGIQRVQKVLGTEVAKDFEHRVRRAIHRRDPNRDKRGSRGSYKRSKTSD